MLKRKWTWLLEQGVSAKHPEENTMIRSYNLMSIISAISAILVFIPSQIIQAGLVYAVISFIVFISYFGTTIAHYFGYIYLPRVVLGLMGATWIALMQVVMGGFFSQGFAIMASIAILYIGLAKFPKLRLWIISYNILVFFISSIYVNLYGAISPGEYFLFDEIIICATALGWTYMVLKNFNLEKDKLVGDLISKQTRLISTQEELEKFSYVASHDLKSPLRTIISFIGLLNRDIKREKYDNINEKLQFIKSGAVKMNILIKDILELSNLNSNSNRLPVLLDLNLILEQVKFNLTEEISNKNAIVLSQILPQTMGVEAEFILLFQNLIQNAIKYNDSQTPRVSIQAKETEEHLRLVFKDNGIGINKKYHKQIFEMFKRLHGQQEYGGTGLGLGLCMKIIQKYDGTVKVKSQEGFGSQFILTFPKNINSLKAESVTSTTTIEL